MAISTRSMKIAQCAGSLVEFGARDPLGSVSEEMFMAHATHGTSVRITACQNPEIRSSVHKILRICAGLPIALAVTGSAVAFAFLSITPSDFEKACDDYARRLERKRSYLGDEDTMEGTSLNASILLSLEFLQDEMLRRKVKTEPFHL